MHLGMRLTAKKKKKTEGFIAQQYKTSQS